MLIAIVKRHRLAIESAIYGSIGSFKKYKIRRSTLKKSKKNAQEKSDADSSSISSVKTATEVAFFPRYSVVNKSWKENKKKLSKNSEKTDILNNEDQEIKKEEDKSKDVDKSKNESVTVNKSSKRSKLEKGNDEMIQTKKGIKMNLNTSKQSLYEIISTLKFKTQQQNLQQQQQPRVANKITDKKGDGHQTSFYFHGGNLSSDGSKYDLTLARGLTKKVKLKLCLISFQVMFGRFYNPKTINQAYIESSSNQPMLRSHLVPLSSKLMLLGLLTPKPPQNLKN